jgi:hypothetical protein
MRVLPLTRCAASGEVGHAEWARRRAPPEGTRTLPSSSSPAGRRRVGGGAAAVRARGAPRRRRRGPWVVSPGDRSAVPGERAACRPRTRGSETEWGSGELFAIMGLSTGGLSG